MVECEARRLYGFYVVYYNSRDNGYNTDFPHGKMVYIDRTNIAELGHYKTEQYIYWFARKHLNSCGFDTFLFFMTLKANSINHTPTNHIKPYEFFHEYAAKRIYSMPPHIIKGEKDLIKHKYLMHLYDNFY